MIRLKVLPKKMRPISGDDDYELLLGEWANIVVLSQINVSPLIIRWTTSINSTDSLACPAGELTHGQV